MLNAFALVLHQILVDLALLVRGLVERNTHNTIRRSHGLRDQSCLGTLDIKVTNFAEVEQPLVEVGEPFHVAEVQIVRQVIDEGQTEALGVALDTREPIVFGIVHLAPITIAVHHVKHAAADTLDNRHIHGLGRFPFRDSLPPFGEGLLTHFLGGAGKADGEPTGTRTMLTGEGRSEGIRFFVNQEVAVRSCK